MTRKNQLRRSGTRLQRQGTLWFQQTRSAGETFLQESRAASVTFAKDLGSAGDKLRGEWSRSADGLRKALQKEAFDWQKLVLQTRDAYVTAFKQRLRGIEAQAMSTKEALKPEAVEATVLESTKELLVKAQTSVDERIEKTAFALAGALAGAFFGLAAFSIRSSTVVCALTKSSLVDSSTVASTASGLRASLVVIACASRPWSRCLSAVT